jgi:NAD(P)-dependent dehydrogenase (short-subunit alcohol dehydrogenase family)
MKDKVFVVTGGTQGIGEGVARMLAKKEAGGLVITGRNRDRGVGLAHKITEAGCPTLFVPASLENEADCRAVIRTADERFGRIDGLVNAAGVTSRGTIENTPVELWDYIFAVNARAPFILAQEAVRVMKREKRGGSIVNIITMSSHGGQPFLTAYSASKGALATLTKNMAHALRFDQIRVNGINMGWAETPGEHAVQKSDGNPADWLDKAKPNQPFKRLLTPDDVGKLATYLLSDDAQMMTGSVIDFDQNVMGAYN